MSPSPRGKSSKTDYTTSRGSIGSKSTKPCFSCQIIRFYRIPSYVAAEKTLAAQMTKLNPNWRIFLLDVQVNNNPHETADGVTIIDLSDD